MVINNLDVSHSRAPRPFKKKQISVQWLVLVGISLFYFMFPLFYFFFNIPCSLLIYSSTLCCISSHFFLTFSLHHTFIFLFLSQDIFFYIPLCHSPSYILHFPFCFPPFLSFLFLCFSSVFLIYLVLLKPLNFFVLTDFILCICVRVIGWLSPLSLCLSLLRKSHFPTGEFSIMEPQ